MSDEPVRCPSRGCKGTFHVWSLSRSGMAQNSYYAQARCTECTCHGPMRETTSWAGSLQEMESEAQLDLEHLRRKQAVEDAARWWGEVCDVWPVIAERGNYVDPRGPFFTEWHTTTKGAEAELLQAVRALEEVENER